MNNEAYKFWNTVYGIAWQTVVLRRSDTPFRFMKCRSQPVLALKETLVAVGSSLQSDLVRSAIILCNTRRFLSQIHNPIKQTFFHVCVLGVSPTSIQSFSS